MKKLLRASALLVAASMMLTGCGEKEVEVVDNTEVISWYLLNSSGDVKTEIEENVEKAANEIITPKTGAKLDIRLIDSASWEDKIKLMAASGDVYDLVLTSDWTNKLQTNVQKGAFLVLDDLVEQYGKNIKEKVDPRAWNAATINGKIMAVPSQGAYAPGASFVFKKDLVEKYNFDYKSVKTLEDLEPYLEIIKENEPEIVPLLASSSGTPGAGLPYLTSIGGGLSYDEQKKQISRYDNLEYTEVYRILFNYYKKGYIAKDAAVKKDFTSEAKSGKYAVLNNSGGYSEDGSKASGIFGYPCVESFISYPYITTSVMIGSATAISRTSKNPEKAMEVLDLVWADPTLSNTLAYGIEGENYTYVSGKGTENPSVEVFSGNKQVWGIPHNFLGPLFDQWDSNWNKKEALEVMRQNNEQAEASGLLGFVFDTEPVKTYVAQVSSINNETRPILMTGSMNDFDEYIAKKNQRLKDAGIEKIIEECEKQIAEWRKANNK